MVLFDVSVRTNNVYILSNTIIKRKLPNFFICSGDKLLYFVIKKEGFKISKIEDSMRSCNFPSFGALI